MSDHIDTRDGTWRKVPPPNFPPKGVTTLREHNADGKMTAIWVKEEPPPLPTEIATLDGADLIFVSEVLRALGTWKQAQR